MRILAAILLTCLPLHAADHPTYVRPHANNKAQIVKGHTRKPSDPNKLSRQSQKPRTSKSS